MQTLSRLDLVEALKDVAASGTPLVGICLGMQLLMSESEEFGRHRGLGLIEGTVVRLTGVGDRIKVPHVSWNTIHRVDSSGPSARAWRESPFEDADDGKYFYFVHSYRVAPADARVSLATTTYAGEAFCSSLMRRNIFGCQFHPERSGANGLLMYRNIAGWCASHAGHLEKRHV